jgi:hypothetical protein
MNILIPMVLVLDPWSRQDIINKGNFFCSVPVENMKVYHSVIYRTTTHPIELSSICHVNTHLHTEMKREDATFSAGKCFQKRYQLIHNVCHL